MMNNFDTVCLLLYKSLSYKVLNYDDTRYFEKDIYFEKIGKIRKVNELINKIYNGEDIESDPDVMPEELFNDLVNDTMENLSVNAENQDFVVLNKIMKAMEIDLINPDENITENEKRKLYFESLLSFFLRLVLYLKKRFNANLDTLNFASIPINFNLLIKGAGIYFKPEESDLLSVEILEDSGIFLGNRMLEYKVDIKTKLARSVTRKFTLMFENREYHNEFNHYSFCHARMYPNIREEKPNTFVTSTVAKFFIEKYGNFGTNLVILVKITESLVEIIERAIESENDSTMVSTENENNNNTFFNPVNHLGDYSYRGVTVPIRNEMFGVEIEYSGDVQKVSNFGKEFKYLLNNGWMLERDESVTFEMKSPIMSLNEIRSDADKCRNLFIAWSKHSDPDKAGLHIHVSMDDMFAVSKYPAPVTYTFLGRFAQEMEMKTFGTVELRKHIFKRDFTDYAKSLNNCKMFKDFKEKYLWVNFQHLERNAGKTIEFRLGSSALANEFDVYAEKVYILAKLIKSALSDWRRKGRPEFAEWKSSFGDQKLLKALLPKDLTKRFVELFK